MGSRYDAKQGIDGIVTLTNDSLAIDNIRKTLIPQHYYKIFFLST